IAECTHTIENIVVQCTRVSEAVLVAKKSKEAFSEWINVPGKLTEGNEKLLRDALIDGEREAVVKAHADQLRLDEASRDLANKLAHAEHSRNLLANQLNQISGGVCPFLKEKCRQFDPKAIRSDLEALEKEHADLGRHHQNSIVENERAKKSF